MHMYICIATPYCVLSRLVGYDQQMKHPMDHICGKFQFRKNALNLVLNNLEPQPACYHHTGALLN